LEKIRLNGQLNYRFHISESVQQKSKIPKMLLHTFIENSIKHGIRHLPFETQGELILSVEQEGDMLHVSIEDNGIGRDAALAYNEYSTKQGLQILNEIISIYKQAERKSIEYAINDSTSFDSGTCVTINLSLN
jgi:LytS/YehU family sensor histidine kinase